MVRSLRLAWLLGMALWAAAWVNTRAAEPAPDRAAALAATIDRLLGERFDAENVKPAPPAGDEEFLRRASLDISGRIPRVAEVRGFLTDTRADKRRRLIDQRLRDPAYVRHWTSVWRAILLAQASAQDLRFLTPHLEAWLTRQVRENAPYDQMVRELLRTPLGDRIASSASSPEQPTALAFYQANELKPEQLASATSRIFLGVNLECAQCHNHPFARWKQDEFWQFAAFFAGVKRLRPDNAFTPAPEKTDRRTIAVAGSGRLVSARYLDASEPDLSAGQSARAALADWITSPTNPYFARAAANRIWAQFFGRGIVDPLDELGGRTAPSHPELLDALARAFIESGYDVQFLIRAITASQAYQRTSRLTDPAQQRPEWFARMLARGLAPEQLFDSLALATGCRPELRGEVLNQFASLERPAESQTSILQALATMNGRLTAEATTDSGQGTLAAVVEAPFLDVPGKLETLFLATVSRRPTAEETERLRRYLAAAADERQGLADIFWALLNSAEFVLNH